MQLQLKCFGGSKAPFRLPPKGEAIKTQGSLF